MRIMQFNRLLALSVAGSVSFCLALTGTAFGERGRAILSDGTLVSDEGSPLRGTRYGLDAQCEPNCPDEVDPPPPGWIEALPSRGINALHVYAESTLFTATPGDNMSSLTNIVERTAASDLYVVITVGGPLKTAPWKQFALDFWSLYASEFKDYTHVIYELQNEAWFDCSTLPCVAQPSPSDILDFEADAYEVVRCAAPDTPILLFSYAFLHDRQGVLSDISAVQSRIGSRTCVGGGKETSLEWTDAGIAFHGYSGAAVTENTLRQLAPHGHGLVETELAPYPGSGDLDVPLIVAYETTRTSWFAFVPWHQLDDSHWNDVLDAAQIAWAADERDYPGTSDPPVGSTVALWSPADDGAYVRVDTATSELIADAATVSPASRFQVESIVGSRYAALKAEANGQYVQRGTDDHLRAESPSPVAFEWIDLPDGKVALQAQSNWRYVAADYNLSPPFLVADRPHQLGPPVTGGWERFVVSVESAPCSPPPSGDWQVSASCTFEGNATAPAGVIVDNDATLTIADGAVLDLDFSQHELLVKSGSQVLVKAGGEIR